MKTRKKNMREKSWISTERWGRERKKALKLRDNTGRRRLWVGRSILTFVLFKCTCQSRDQSEKDGTTQKEKEKMKSCPDITCSKLILMTRRTQNNVIAYMLLYMS